MPDYIADLKEVSRRCGGSPLKVNVLLRKLDRLVLDMERRGVDLNSLQQQEVCRAVCTSPENAKEWMFNLCMARLIRGDYSDWTGWEFRNKFAEGSYSSEVPNRRWRLEPADSISVLGEQGIGDEVQFLSCLWDLVGRVSEVEVEVNPRLVGVVGRSFPVKVMPRSDMDRSGGPLVKYLTRKRETEYFTLAGELPRLFRKKLADFPRRAYLKPLPEMVEKWGHLRGRVGVAWRSRTGVQDPKDFGVKDPVCLQYDVWEGHIETEGMHVPDINLRDDIEDILGILANLEKVVCGPNTVVHFAGSIGTRVEVVMPPVGSGRIENQFPWRYTSPMPWYPNVEVFENVRAYRAAQHGRV